MLTGTLEELSNQLRSKKIGDGTEMKETELDVLQRQQNKGAKDWESGGRGIVPGTLLKLLVKDKLPHSKEVPVNAKEWQLKPLRREKEDYSRWGLTSKKGWQLKPRRKKIIADENQPARKFWQLKPPEERERRSQQMSTNQRERLAVETLRRKITADEHQPARKVDSWNSWGERTLKLFWYM